MDNDEDSPSSRIDLPLISIIIPAYNVGAYVETSVRSAVAQSYPLIEVVVVDDGSTDETRRLCAALAENTKRIRLFHKSNGGLSDARNFGLKHAQGDYVVFLDADDVLDESMVQSMYQGLIDCNADLAVCALERVVTADGYSSELAIPFVPVDAHKFVRSVLYGRESISACGKLATRRKWLEFPFPTGRLYEDISPVLGLLASIDTVASTQTTYYGYLARPDSITSGTIYSERHAIDLTWVLQDARKQLLINMPTALSAWPTFSRMSALRVAGRLPARRDERSTEVTEDFVSRAKRGAFTLFLTPGIGTTWKLRGMIYSLSPALYKVLFSIYARITGKSFA